ncbi:MAG: CHASE3 domain-containing protein [Odoribacter sp.]|nr:CHASE3 domain-containing protein [Odoribacter sp.]
MNKPRTQYTKIKVKTGYILFFLLAVISIVFIYQQITGLAVGDKDSSSVNKKLLFIGNTVTSLYEAEALSSSFIQTGSQETFDKYLAIVNQVEENIDSLKRLTDDPEQHLRIDAIQILLEEKVNNLKELIRIKQPPAEDFYIQGINFLESQRDSTPNNAFVIKRVVTTRDSTYVPQEEVEKRRFLDLFKTKKIDSTLHVTVSEYVMYDTITPPAPENYADTILNSFKNIWESIWETYITETENYRQQINQQEYNIVNQSVHITEQLKQVLNQFEAEEITNSVNFLTEQQDIITDTTNLIAKIAIIAFIVLILFSFLTLKDISRGQRYRKELETANQYTDQLLESKEKLILTVTHDIKTPLNSIMGYIELLHARLNKRQNYYLKNMKSTS